nr:hypothetical protein [Kofleriaceae bacterium]
MTAWTQLHGLRGRRPICALADGRVLAFADDVLDRDPRAWLYDPVADACTDAAEPLWRSSYPCAVVSAEGWVVTAGGTIGPDSIARCALYDPATDRWHAMPDMPEARRNHELVLAGGRVHVVGGQLGQDRYLATTWSWAPGEDWRHEPAWPGAPQYLDACALDDASLVAWGAHRAGPAYRLHDGRWSELGPVELGACLVASPGGLLAIGGERAESHAEVRAWTATHGWRARPALPATRTRASAIRLADGRLAVLGGQRHGDELTDSSTGGELDHEYRSFPQRLERRPAPCRDLELETATGWVTVSSPEAFDGSSVLAPQLDGRLVVAPRYRGGAYLWTPPDPTRPAR